MRIKSFYADSVESAVAAARREMGPEAMLVESRQAPLGARHMGEYEVVCALVPEAESAKPPDGSELAAHDSRLACELAEMRRQLDLMGKTITRSAWNGNSFPSSSPLAEWHARLMATDMDGELVHEILCAAEHRGQSDGLDAAILAEIERRVVSGSGSPGEPATRALVVAGPPGAGKTATLVKLAVSNGLAARRPVAFISMDDFRVAGADQLRSYATILGVGFQAIQSVAALSHALNHYESKRLILIDTPGYGARDMDRAEALARFLSSRPEISTHLVLTAFMKSADLTSVAERFEIFHPSRLLFTRLDETACFGSAFSLSVRMGKAISFLGTGQEIPDDLAPATKDRIVSLLWPQVSGSNRLAA